MEAGKAVPVVGAGNANGGAIARRFAREGFIASVTRRQADKLAPLVERIRVEGGQARGFGSDARDEAAVITLVSDPEVKAQLIATTDEAVARGVFGAPACFVGEQMVFGQDRLDFVRKALAGFQS